MVLALLLWAGNAAGFGPAVIEPERADLSKPVRELAPVMRSSAVPGTSAAYELATPRRQLPLDLGANYPDAAVQSLPPAAAMPSLSVNVEGINNINHVLPPDTTGAVGPNHFVQWVNLSFAVYDKTGVKLAGPFAGNSLWSGFGGPCESHNDGDIIVLYDHLDDRWLMAQFAIPGGALGYHECIAVSQSGDPLGAWYRYDYLWPGGLFADYPKFGLWPDGYYFTSNQFANCNSDFSSCTWAGAGVAVFERDKMLAGQAARIIYFDLGGVNLNFGGMLPADLDGPAPPAGAPGLIVEMDDDAWGFPQDQVSIWEFRADWTNTSASTLGLAGNPNLSLPTAAFDTNLCAYARNCIAQPGGLPKLDAMSDRLMQRLQYRNFGSYQTLVVNHTVDVSGADHAGVRWYELEDNGSGWTIAQQGTYAPDAAHRWMGSAAMDSVGNIALGYSVASSTVSPSIRYAGRLAGDPANTLPQGESVIINGAAGQESATGRWGDYSAMTVDPADDCTFWYTQEYYASNVPANDWRTRIAAFRFPSCVSGPSGDLEGHVRDFNTFLPVAGARIATDARTSTTNGAGDYTMLNLAPDSYDVTAEKYGYQSKTVTGVSIADGVTTVLDFDLVPLPRAAVSGVVRDAVHLWPLYAKLHVVHLSGFETTVFTDPATGAYAVELVQGDSVSFTVDSIFPGYQAEVRTVTPAADPWTEDFDLVADETQDTCPAGFDRAPFYEQDFEADNGGYTVFTITGVPSWKWGTPTSGPGAAHSGSRVWATNLSGNYNRNEAGCAASPAIDLSSLAGHGLRLGWWEWLQTEPDSYGRLWDYAWVDVSKNGGTTWQQVFGPVFGNYDLQWNSRQAGLDATYAVSNFRVRFCLLSDQYSIEYPGFYVDDVTVGPADCFAQAGGLVIGTVRDQNTALGLAGATVRDNEGRETSSLATPDDPAVGDGIYNLFQPAGARALEAFGVLGYGSDHNDVTVSDDTVSVQDFDLPAGLLSASPSPIHLYASPANPTASATLAITNLGGYAAAFHLWEVASPYVPAVPTGPFAVHTRHLGPKNLNRPSLEGVAYYAPLPDAPALAAGAVLSEWRATQNAYGWGLGFDSIANQVWVGDYINLGFGADRDYRYTPAGSPLAGYIDLSSWTDLFAADMAYDPATRTLWQVNVGGDNCIYQLNPITRKATGQKLCPPFGTSERGLAYDRLSNTFYAGSWNDGVINHFNTDGVILDSKNVNLPIAGLAFNPLTGHLFATVNAIGPDVYVLDPSDGYTIIGAFSIAGLDDYNQAGLEMDCSGNLFVVDMNDTATTGNATVIKAESGEASDCSFDIPWLTLNPTAATVDPAATVLVQLTANSAGLPLGDYVAHLRLYDDSPYGVIAIPVTLHVVANSPPVADAGPDQWVLLGAAVALDGTGSSDPDGSIASYLWAQSSGAAVTLTGDASATPTFTAPGADAILSFTLTVTDNDGATASDQVTVTVSANQPPVANAGPDQNAAAGQAVTLDGDSSSDPDGSIAAWEWVQTAGAFAQLTGSNTSQPVFTAPSFNGDLVFQLTVTDNQGARDSDTVKITVTVPPPPPSGSGGGGGNSGCGCMIAPGVGPARALAASWLYLAIPGAYLVMRLRLRKRIGR